MNKLEQLKYQYNRNFNIRDDIERGLTSDEINTKYLNISGIKKYQNYPTFHRMQTKLYNRITELESIATDFKRGIPITKIAARLGTSRQAVNQKLHSMGMYKDDGGRTVQRENRNKIIKVNIQEGKTAHEIEALLGVERSVILSVAKEQGLELKTEASKKKEKILALDAEGKNQLEIAKILGIPQSNVSYYLVKEKGKRNRTTPEEKKERDREVISLYQSGKSVREISDMLGYVEGTIYKILKDNNVKNNQVQVLAEERHKLVIAYYKEGKKLREIAKLTNYSMTAVHRILVDNKVIRKPRAVRSDRNSKVLELYHKGIATKEILETVGISMTTYYSILKNNGIKTRNSRKN